MPKIDAPTVAEHHKQRRASLIEAATSLLAAGGVEAVTLGAVGAATGLARSSVYQYFDSSAGLIAAVVEDAFPRATAQLTSAVERAGTPIEKVDAYVRTSVALATDDAHRSLSGIGWAGLPPQCRNRLDELHDAQVAPLQAALADLGATDPELTTVLVMGLIRAAAGAVNRGAPRSRVLQETERLIHEGVPRLM